MDDKIIETNNDNNTVEEKKKFNWKKFWDKCTTGLLILFLASPFLILLYIFLWFIFR